MGYCPALVAFGALTTIPLIVEFFGARPPLLEKEESHPQWPASLAHFVN